ncbi:zinc finger protein [Abeliophyllum distichum]|uniref:Zinc finger protein n=1 Tax=Abeliophyllum distichum TaxID=126358 RepID=A0ABD1UJG5_9LAMI
MGKDNRKDPAWKYGREVENEAGDKKTYIYIECMFCKNIIIGGVKRMKDHLACTHKNVVPCPGVSEDVKNEIINYLKVEKLQKDLAQQQFEDMIELGSCYGKNDKTNSRRSIRGPIDRFVTNIGGDEEQNTYDWSKAKRAAE